MLLPVFRPEIRSVSAEKSLPQRPDVLWGRGDTGAPKHPSDELALLTTTSW